MSRSMERFYTALSYQTVCGIGLLRLENSHSEEVTVN